MVARRVARELERWRRRRHAPARDRLPSIDSPVRLGDGPVEIHSLVCARDVRMSIWSLLSFVVASGASPRVVIHDDGTLTEEHHDLYARHFARIAVLDGRESSARMDEALAPWPASRRFRRDPAFHCTRKLFDPLFFARSGTVLLLDSDVLFFAHPEVLLRHLAAGSACFGSDYQDSYTAPRRDLARFVDAPVVGCLNAGILGVPIDAYRAQLDRIECFLAYAERKLRPRDVNFHEQTSHALAMSALGAARLPPDYRLQGPLDAATVSYHFVGESRGRKRFWDEGVVRVERSRGWPARGPFRTRGTATPAGRPRSPARAPLPR